MDDIMLTVESFNSENIVFFEKARLIRKKVFVEEQNVSDTDEFDEFENIATHYLLLEDNNPIGTARWRETDKGVKLERFALLLEHRNTGKGTELLKRVLIDNKEQIKPLYLHAQLSAVSFYEKAGFIKEGEIFEECKIQHYLMRYLNTTTNKRKVLIIDDEEDICFLLNRLLRNQNFSGEYALSISEGQEKLKILNPELLFLDISLPDGSGLESIGRFKEINPSLKIIVISAYDNDYDRAEAKKAGADSFVPKPFNKSIISEVLNELFED